MSKKYEPGKTTRDMKREVKDKVDKKAAEIEKQRDTGGKGTKK
jgi:hypothetical protein